MVYLEENTVKILDTVKVLLLQSLIEIIVKFRAEKILHTFVSCTKQFFEGHEM